MGATLSSAEKAAVRRVHRFAWKPGTSVCCWQLHFSGGKKSRPEEWHGNKLCSNTTQKRGKRVSKPERAGYEFRCGARIPQGRPRPGHGIAAMSKAMPSVRATATAAAHF